MKSPFTIHPQKLLWPAFILVILGGTALTAILNSHGIKINTSYAGLGGGIILILFFFVVLPLISKNKEYQSQLQEDRIMEAKIRQFSEFRTIRILAAVILGITVVGWGSVALLYYLERYEQLCSFLKYFGSLLSMPLWVSVLMNYKAKVLQKHKETEAYGVKLQTIITQGPTTLNKSQTIGSVMMLLIIQIILFFIF